LCLWIVGVHDPIMGAALWEAVIVFLPRVIHQ